MIQLNLLPDVKLQYIKSQQSRRLVLTISVLAGGVSLAILLLLISVNGLQRKHLQDLSDDIKSESSELQHKPQISKILTVQNQLGSLSDLHSQKPAASRLFGFLNEMTPSTASISDLNVDFTTQIATITGSADALASVNKYVDTLKFTNYTIGDSTKGTKAFSNVVLTTFSVNSASNDKSQAVTYTITLNYDKTLFDITQEVKLDVPNLTTTRAGVDQAGDLFKAAPAGTTSSGGNH